MLDCDIKVTVVIPVFNNEEFLQKCLDNVLSQTLEEIEVICINDGSTDHSLDIMQKYQKNDGRVHIYSIPNSGSGKARNIGIRKAKGKYIAFMDADDWYYEADALQVLYQKAVEKNVDICGGSMCLYSNGRTHIATGKYYFQNEGYIKFEDYQFCHGYQKFIYKTEMLRTQHIYFPYYLRYQDPPFMLNAMMAAGTFYVIHKVIYCHYIRPGHVNWTHQRICDCIRGKAYIFRVSKQNELEQVHIEQVKQFLGELNNIDISIGDLTDKKIRDAIERMHREIDYELLYRKGVLKRHENIKTKTYAAILHKTIDKNWGKFK
jgi:glycosyltransferase involved in cell wall biosynthesis